MKPKYKLEDVKIGNQLMFKRTGLNDFDEYWTVIGFLNKSIHVKIAENGHKDEIYIDVTDITMLSYVDDKRYQ